MHISLSLGLILTQPADFLSSLGVLCRCYFQEGLCHHLNDQGNFRTRAPLCFSEPFCYLLQLSHQLKVSGQTVTNTTAHHPPQGGLVRWVGQEVLLTQPQLSSTCTGGMPLKELGNAYFCVVFSSSYKWLPATCRFVV